MISRQISLSFQCDVIPTEVLHSVSFLSIKALLNILVTYVILHWDIHDICMCSGGSELCWACCCGMIWTRVPKVFLSSQFCSVFFELVGDLWPGFLLKHSYLFAVWLKSLILSLSFRLDYCLPHMHPHQNLVDLDPESTSKCSQKIKVHELISNLEPSQISLKNPGCLHHLNNQRHSEEIVAQPCMYDTPALAKFQTGTIRKVSSINRTHTCII